MVKFVDLTFSNKLLLNDLGINDTISIVFRDSLKRDQRQKGGYPALRQRFHPGSCFFTFRFLFLCTFFSCPSRSILSQRRSYDALYPPQVAFVFLEVRKGPISGGPSLSDLNFSFVRWSVCVFVRLRVVVICGPAVHSTATGRTPTHWPIYDHSVAMFCCRETPPNFRTEWNRILLKNRIE